MLWLTELKAASSSNTGYESYFIYIFLSNAHIIFWWTIRTRFDTIPEWLIHQWRWDFFMMKSFSYLPRVVFIAIFFMLFIHFTVVLWYSTFITYRPQNVPFHCSNTWKKLMAWKTFYVYFFQKFVISDYWLLYGSTSNFLYRNLVLSNMPDRLFIVSHDEKKESC